MAVKIKELTIKATFVDKGPQMDSTQQVQPNNNNSRIQSNMLREFYNDNTKKNKER